MKTKNGFILTNINEFREWLEKEKVTREIKFLQQHHTFKPNYKDWKKNDDHFYWLESMKEYHIKERGFADTAQNLTVFPDGMIAVCRPFTVAPAGIYGFNNFALCIEYLGDFDTDKMTKEQEQAVYQLNALLCQKFNLVPSGRTILYHCWFNRSTGQRDNDDTKIVDTNHKTCPGKLFCGGNSLKSMQENLIPKIKEYMDK